MLAGRYGGWTGVRFLHLSLNVRHSTLYTCGGPHACHLATLGCYNPGARLTAQT